MAGRGESEYVVALHDFVPVNGNTTCLSFRAGQLIHVLNRDSTGWWDGELEGRRGWFPSNYVKASKRKSRESMSSESGSEAEACPRVMVSLYHALLVLNTSVHASRISHYQPSTACVISSVRTVLTATDCLHKTAPALARFPHLARARSDVLQELGRLVAVSKKASAPDVSDDERTWLAESMLRFGDAVFACCKRYVEVAVSCGVHVAGRSNVHHPHHPNELAPRLTSASVSSLSSVSSSASPASPEIVPSGHVPSAQLLSALRTTHDHLLSIIAAFIGHVHSHSRASHASSKGHLIKMTRETVDKVRQVLTIVCAVCDHPAVVGPERVALSAAKDALHGATSVLVEAVKRMLAPGTLNREEEEKALAVQAATGTLRAGGDCVTAVRSCLTRRSGYEPTAMLVFDVPPPPPSASDHARSMRSASPSESEPDSAGGYRRDAVYGSVEPEAGPSNHGTIRAMRASAAAARQRASILASRTTWQQASSGRSTAGLTAATRRRPSAGESLRRTSEEEWRRATYVHPPETASSGEEEPRRSNESMRSVRSARHSRTQRRPTITEQSEALVQAEPEPEHGPGNDSITVRPEQIHEPTQPLRPATPIQEDVPDEPEKQEVDQDTRLDEPIPEAEEVPREDDTPRPLTQDVPPPLPPKASPHDIPLPDDVQSMEDDDVQAQVPVVVSTTTSPTRSFERESQFRTEPGSPSTLEFRRSSRFTVGSLFESTRTSEDTAATTIIPEKTDHSDNHLGLNGFGNDDDEVDTESLMAEPPMVRGLVAIDDDDDDVFDEDGIDRTPLPPSQNFDPPEEQGEEGFRDDGDIKHRGDKSLPDIPISQKVDLLAVQTIDPRDVAYGKDGNLVGATLDVLVEKMTAPDRTPDPKFAATFFLSFRLFTTPLELVQVLHKRWDMRPPLEAYSQEEYNAWCHARLNPVRWRVYNFIKTWLDAHWQHAADSVALAPLQEFVSATASKMHHSIVQRVVDLLTQRQPESEAQLATSRPMDRARSNERMRTKPTGSAPTPIMSKSLFSLLKSGSYASVNVVDFDALELARQLTILESNLYSKILPEEILDVGLPSSAGERGNSIRAMSTLSTAITGWVTEIILDEQDTKKRTGLLKLFIKVADHCDDLSNFSTLRSILAALDSSTISRLSKTWMGLSAKNKTRLENLRKLTDHTRNHYEYRARLRSVRGHAVPFLGLYLTDVTFCREGNPDKRIAPYDNSRTLLNFDKYRRLAAIAEDVQRFQVPYNLIEVPEVQKYLDYVFEKVKKSGNDLHDLYRRSLLVEPRQPTDSLETKTNSIKSSELFGWASRDKS
ncbi:Cell division control protein 25 [Rhizoctonia solani AG-1 IB]|uniref:Cell division control protein 25 n=1 Tax=Thanatephorus cucumeris (strain AG1-IB / isolate 7/3/14) TaxID=1108050 RepID=M5BU90_THACB|nr:Cell division control protein 25 [Rhizoctonia solani AG-1 IB]